MTISLDSDKIQKRTVPHLKAENLIITAYLKHFLRKSLRAATDQNVWVIFFVTVSIIHQEGSAADSAHLTQSRPEVLLT